MPFVASAVEKTCAVVGASMETRLFDSLRRDLSIDTDTIEHDKTVVEVIDISPVSSVFARQLMEKRYASDIQRFGKGQLSKESYYEIYKDYAATSITAKYTYINNKGQRSKFIAMSLFNKYECSVGFNEYITLSREF